MKCAIITPPYIRPTGPPLGPAVLASYLKKKNPLIRVRNFDLNFVYYSTALKAVGDEPHNLPWASSAGRFKCTGNAHLGNTGSQSGVEGVGFHFNEVADI
ncbi:MAG: hypothetical protein JRE64_17345, partial [Deltaproteobacteria bacterium]|nr:hypothetical protein [Deltaproteobacteria bacterium]